MKKHSIRRLLSAGVAACLLFTFSGCTDQNGPAPSPAPSESELTAVRTGLQKASQIEGLGTIDKMELYENGERSAATEIVEAKDNKVIYYSGDTQRVVNYPDGYILDLPASWKQDFSYSPIRVRYTSDDMVLTITTEELKKPSAEEHLEEYVNLHLLDRRWQALNRVSPLQPVETKTYGEFTAQIIRMQLKDMPEGSKDHYTYVNLYSNRTTFYHFLFRSTGPIENLEEILNSFERIPQKGLAMFAPLPEFDSPTIDENWTPETKALYDTLCSQKKMNWGIFQSNMASTGYNIQIPNMEKKVGYDFPIMSQYIHLQHEFPLELARQIHEDGKILQLSYQYTTSNNTDLGGYTPVLDILRGEKDETLRAFARALKEYGQPTLLRLNNEMNSDWTTYCALVNMVDADSFVESWMRLYNICKEEGVNNAIWVFNPQSGSFPPGKWSNWINYLPPIEAVHVIGLTAYCSGYKGFPSWKEMYTENIRQFAPFFQENWPMAIPEFACGRGDGTLKQQQLDWIAQTFKDIESLPQIKYGIWFSANDYTEDGSKIVNHYSLDIKDKDLMEAFRKGFAEYYA
ncbi:MAG: hypothetical protein HFJ80_04275 [Clostridiales bacterium]|nr:hypothetical protein [Clostridiales bacterium]